MPPSLRTRSLKRPLAIVGIVLAITSPLWRFIGDASNLAFLVHVGDRLGVHLMALLSRYGPLIVGPLGLVLVIGAVLYRDRNSLQQQPWIQFHELHDVRLGVLSKHWKTLFIQNGGARGRFWATYTLHGGQVQDWIGTVVGEPGLVAHQAWWRKTPTTDEGASAIRKPDIKLATREGGFIYLGIFGLPQFINPTVMNEVASLTALRDDGRETCPYVLLPHDVYACDLVLTVFSEPPLVEPWQRRFRVDSNGICEIPNQ